MKNKLVLLFLIIAAAVLGALIGDVVQGVHGLSWLAYAKSIGFDATTLKLDIFDITFGVHFSMNVAQILLLCVALLSARKLSDAIQV